MNSMSVSYTHLDVYKRQLLDFGNIVVHLFNKEDRDFYNLERLWGDAKIVSEDDLK